MNTDIYIYIYAYVIRYRGNTNVTWWHEFELIYKFSMHKCVCVCRILAGFNERLTYNVNYYYYYYYETMLV